jgi:hypothetical protein
MVESNVGMQRRYGDLILENTIVAGNAPAERFQVFGEPTAEHSIITGNPLLAPLGDYGGPLATMPPLPGSPAIDAGAAGFLPRDTADADGDGDTGEPVPFDQRGGVRTRGAAPDAGAVEAFAFSSLPMLDQDADGIDDRLEPAYPHLTLGVDDSGSDFDHDGISDAREIADMTDPLDPVSRFSILSFRSASGFDRESRRLFAVEFSSFPGLSYRVEAAPTPGFFEPRTVAGPVWPASSRHSLEVELRPDEHFVRIVRE